MQIVGRCLGAAENERISEHYKPTGRGVPWGSRKQANIANKQASRNAARLFVILFSDVTIGAMNRIMTVCVKPIELF